MGNLTGSKGSKSGSNRQITIPGSPQSVSTSLKRRTEEVHPGTVTVTPQHKPQPIERVFSNEIELMQININTPITPITPITPQDTATPHDHDTATPNMEHLSLADLNMISGQSSGDELETHTPITDTSNNE